MYYITAIYPYQDGAYFNFDYYKERHIPLLISCFGDNFIDIQVRQGLAGIERDSPDFICIFSMRVHSFTRWQDQIKLHGDQIFNDTKNFTNLEPIIQIDQLVCDTSVD